ncbi:MAG: PAS domain S-box protein, partial [Armatimonadota bacterium]|nr:PAS domain S-box protein [Armatimonadota bacterium]
MSGLDHYLGKHGKKQDNTSVDKKSGFRVNRSADEIAANYAAVTDNAPTGIVIIQHGKVVYANPYILRLMGYTNQELPHLDIWQMIHPEDRERVRHHYLARMRGEESPEEYDFRVVTRTGEVRHVELRATLIQYDGEPAVLDHIVDVTDRKRAERGLTESEQRYRRLVDLSPDAIVVVCKSRVVFVNNAALSVYGASSSQELIGRQMSELVAPSESDGFAARLRSVLEWEPGASLAAEVCFHRLDGTPFVAEVAAARIDYDGKPAVLAVIRDITERKKAEQHRRELKQQLEQHKRQFYRDAILSITNGKLDI